MDYAAATAWLDSFVNLEARLDPRQWSTVKLARVQRLVAALGEPQRAARVVHIAGSKGKGSVAAIVAAVLRAAGQRVGLYTSPHLISSRERIRVDGRQVDEATFAHLVLDRLRPVADAYQADPVDGSLTYFDLHFALACLVFATAQVDWAVIEVGLGGRLDATNVVSPEVCAITTLDLEHTALLGDTIEQIAAEKAGIIKPGVPVVTAPQSPAAQAVVEAVAAERGAPLLPATGVWAVDGGAWCDDGQQVSQQVVMDWAGAALEVRLPLLGPHQVVNAAVARTVLEHVAPVAGVTGDQLRTGCAAVDWPGRLQVIERRPWLVLDGAHTPVAAQRLAESMALFPHRRRWMVLGSALDKDFAGMVPALVAGAAGVVVTGVPDNFRAARPDDLQAVVAPHGVLTVVRQTPAEALALARSWATEEDLIVVAGSLYLVGAMLRLWHGPSPL